MWNVNTHTSLIGFKTRYIVAFGVIDEKSLPKQEMRDKISLWPEIR